jgi:hypothetical protein
MSLPDSLFLSISATLTHARDFTFSRNNGEIANRIRADLEKHEVSSLRDITIDSDNDILVRTKMGTFYVTPNGISTSGWLTQLKDLQETPTISEYSRLIDVLAGASSSISADWYTVRLLFRFTPDNGLDLLQPKIIDTALQSMLADRAPQHVSSFKNTVSYWRDQFSTTLELEVSPSETEFRCYRGGLVGFDSYHRFLQAANLNDLIADVEPFLEFLETNEPKPVIRKSVNPKKNC